MFFSDAIAEFFLSSSLDIILKRIFSIKKPINNENDDIEIVSTNLRTLLVSLLSGILSHIFELSNGNNSSQEYISSEIIQNSVNSIMVQIDEISVLLNSEIPWTLETDSVHKNGNRNGNGKNNLNLNLNLDHKINTPSLLGKRMADCVRSLYVQANKNKIENEIKNKNLKNVSAETIAESKLRKKLTDFDNRINEISVSQDMISKNTVLKNNKGDEVDKERAQLEKVFLLREMSLDKIQLMLEVSTYATSLL